MKFSKRPASSPLRGRALITGGTSGIGLAFAKALAARGCDLTLVARNRARLDDVSGALARVYGVDCDVLAVCERLADRPVEVLVNNAGQGLHHELATEDTKPLEDAIFLMGTAVVRIGAAAGAAMKGRGHGVIVNTASVSGLVPMGLYSAIKSLVKTWSESLTIELEPHGVRVLTFMPGWVRTEFHERSHISTSNLPGFIWLDADDVARAALAAVDAGKTSVTPSLKFKVIVAGGPRAQTGRERRGREDQQRPRPMSQELEPLDPYFDAKKARRRRRVRKYMTRPAMSIVLKSTVLGEENVHGLEGAFILVPNHSSHLDAPMVFSLLPEWLTERLATGAAADYFYRRRGISALTSVFFNSYPIERKGKRETAEHGRAAGMTGRLLRAGVPILVFPEGTRSRTGDIGQFKSGAAALSTQVGVPLVPIAMLGGHEAMPVGSFFPKLRSEVFLFIGAPMRGREGESADDFMGRVFHAIELMLDQHTPHPVEKDGSSPFGEADDAA